jgi:hypothetical protein
MNHVVLSCTPHLSSPICGLESHLRMCHRPHPIPRLLSRPVMAAASCTDGCTLTPPTPTTTSGATSCPATVPKLATCQWPVRQQSLQRGRGWPWHHRATTSGSAIRGGIRATPTASLFLIAKFEGLALCKNRKLQNYIE